LALYVLEECALSWAIEAPEAKIMLVNHSHPDRPPFGGDVKRHGKGGGASTPLGETTIATAPTNNLRIGIGPLPATFLP
jgi:hypothetical protein